MRIAEANTCYLRSEGNKSCQFRNVGEVDDQGYDDETYYVDATHIYNEAAVWGGFGGPLCQDDDIIIAQEDYDRLKTFVNESKAKIVESLKEVSKVRDRDLKIGDCLFSHYEAETDDICDYDSSSCYKILEILENEYKVVCMLYIDPYNLMFEESIEKYSDDLAEEVIASAMLIDEVHCIKANEEAKAMRDNLVEMVKTLMDTNN